MATRQEIQIALDLIKRVNCANDLLDTTVPLLNGEKLVREGEFGSPTIREMTLEEKRIAGKKAVSNAKIYTSNVKLFLGNAGNRTKATSGLGVLGVSLSSIETDNNALDISANAVGSDLDAAKTQEDIDTVKAYITTNVEPLGLVRTYK